MGCALSSPDKGDGNGKKIRKPKSWKHPQQITKTQLMQMRDEFWDTAPHYGGRKAIFILLMGTEGGVINFRTQDKPPIWDVPPTFSWQLIWDALRAAAETDLTLAQAIVDSAGIIIQSADLTICYDERGAKYELPKYVLSEPTNLIRDG